MPQNLYLIFFQFEELCFLLDSSKYKRDAVKKYNSLKEQVREYRNTGEIYEHLPFQYRDYFEVRRFSGVCGMQSNSDGRTTITLYKCNRKKFDYILFKAEAKNIAFLDFFNAKGKEYNMTEKFSIGSYHAN